MSEHGRDVSDVLLLDRDEIIAELKSAHDAMCMLAEPADIAHDDLLDTEDEDEDDDVHMFHPGFEENANVMEPYQQINTMFLNTMQFHHDNPNLPAMEQYRGFISILGLLSQDEIDSISAKAIIFFIQSADCLAGDNHPLTHYDNIPKDDLRVTLFEKMETCKQCARLLERLFQLHSKI